MVKRGQYLNAAERILKRFPKGLHYREITRIAIAEGLIAPSTSTPEASMRGQLGTAAKEDLATRRFLRVGRGLFTLVR